MKSRPPALPQVDTFGTPKSGPVRGTIEPGKIADLVLLDHDPLADIHNTRSIRAVVLGGKLLARATLDAMLTQAEASAAK
jgi:hypothetical protein